jgi:hypothetical protein
MALKFAAILTIWCLLAVDSFTQAVNAEIFIAQSDSISDNVLLDDSTIYHIRTIVIKGNKQTRDNIAFREVALKAGESYSGRDLFKRLRLTKEQLMNTTMFVNVSSQQFLAPNGQLDIVITVAERWYIFPIPYFKVVDRNWNVWINDYKASLSRTQFGLKLTHNNTTGRNDRLNIWVIAGYTQQLEFKYQSPFVDKKMEKGFTVGMSYGRNRELNFATDSNRQKFYTLPNFGRSYFRAEGAFSYRKGSQMRFYLRSVYGLERIDSIFLKLNPSYLNGRTQATFVDLSATYQYLSDEGMVCRFYRCQTLFIGHTHGANKRPHAGYLAIFAQNLYQFSKCFWSQPATPACLFQYPPHGIWKFVDAGAGILCNGRYLGCYGPHHPATQAF